MEDVEHSDYLVPYLLNRAAGSFNRRWLDHLREHGMTVARWQALAILIEYDGARVGQVAEMSSAEQAVTSRVVEQLERDGLVERRPATDDRRAVEVWLTKRGRSTYRQLFPAAAELVDAAIEGVPAESRVALVASLVTLIENLDGKGAPVVNAHDAS